jgi:Endoglucanase
MTPEKSWIRGVNLGGLFLLERFITPYFFALTTCHLKGDFHFYPQQIDAPPNTSSLYKLLDSNATDHECVPVTPYPVDEWTLTAAFGNKSIAKQYLEIHYDNFVTKQDIDFLKQSGVTYLRVPLGHWITGNIADDEPYVDGGWPYFKRLVEWCREAGIQVWPDIHTAPGSQNGFDNSGHLLSGPTCHGWDMDDASAKEYNATLLSMTMGLGVPGDDEVVLSKNVKRSLDIVNEITMAIAKDNMTDVVTGFGVLNEPFANCDMGVVRKFDSLALDIVKRNMGSQTSIYIGDVFNASKWNDGWWTEARFKGTYLDSHYYHVFDERPRHLSPRQHIALVCQKNRRDTVACCYQDKGNRTIPSMGMSRIIGEWSVSVDTLVCDKLDVVMSGIRTTGMYDMICKLLFFPKSYL